MTPERPRFFGTHFRKFAVAGFELSLSRASVPKEELPEHHHDDAHFIFAIDAGYLSRAFGNGEQGRGLDLIHNPPGTEHRDCFYEPGGRFLSIGVPRAISRSGDAPTRVVGRRANALVSRVVGLCASGSPADLSIENLALELLGSLEDRDDDDSVRWIGDADDLIRARAVDQGVTVAALAKELGLHPVYFARAYRASRGQGPAAAIQGRRVQEAAAMLSHDLALADVAAACGFADQSHLSRAMSKAFGAAPGQLRSAFA